MGSVTVPHVPLMQVACSQPDPFVVQVWPHIPQLSGLEPVLMHTSPDDPAGQQTSPEAQGCEGLFMPGGMGEQVPGALGVLQEEQVPVQAVLQQTRSAQKPLVHSPGPRHPTPLDLVGLQAPATPSQNWSGPHSELIVHGVHTPALQ